MSSFIVKIIIEWVTHVPVRIHENVQLADFHAAKVPLLKKLLLPILKVFARFDLDHKNSRIR